MLNLDETINSISFYNNQRDLYLKGILYSIGVIIFIEIVRSQVAEVNLLQLIPGFYLILLFASFLFLVILSDLIFKIPVDVDNKKEIGTKTINKLESVVLSKFSFFLLFTYFILILNTIIPLSLDSFNSYGEKTLENIWSFDEVLNLEITLLTALTFLSQFPRISIVYLSTQKDSEFLPEFWKILSLVIFLFSGFITPTIDGYTQLSFAFSGISLYLIIINLIQKRINVKFCGNNSLNS